MSGENAMDDHFAENYPEMAAHILSPRRVISAAQRIPTTELPASAPEQTNKPKAKTAKPEIDPVMQKQQSLF